MYCSSTMMCPKWSVFIFSQLSEGLLLGKSLQSCPTLCNPMDCSLPGYYVYGILQAGILEWVALLFARGSSQPRDRTCISHISCINTWVRACQVALVVKNPPANAGRRHKRCRFDPWVGKIPWRRAGQPIPVFLPEEPHGQRSLAGHSPQGCKESGMTEVTYYHNRHHSQPNLKLTN